MVPHMVLMVLLDGNSEICPVIGIFLDQEQNLKFNFKKDGPVHVRTQVWDTALYKYHDAPLELELVFNDKQ